MCDKTRNMSDWTITEHDLKVFERWLKGDSVRMIAMDEYVSTQRIYQIITKVRLYRGDDIYADPYDLRYLQSITPRTRKFLIKRGAKDLKELTEWVKHNRLTTIPGVGDTIEKKILIQLNDFMKQEHDK
nr:MAG TPA: Helix-hairpin-helix domain [Caudoviricetes sp.]